ncbi:PREDICTED: exocyst complex component EXO70B1-like [Camelina sativa]|uniref:Exocyst subunit Exo70 family protein n=1 Tax=Camelina sativa TaxID=90675 RepID=A0ABM0XIL5_CAMSA|nr:PREDICTED: exocyst complex component EXO70B1-like [Camelina sativa]
MRSKSGFSFFSKITSSRKRPSFSIPSKSYDFSGIDKTIDNAAEIIEKWNTEYVSSNNFYSLFCESKREAKKFVRRVKELQNAMDLLIREDPSSDHLLRAQRLMQIAMKRLQKEFLQILSMNRAHLDPESVSTRSPTSVVSNDEGAWHDYRSVGDSIIEVEEVSKNSRTELKSIAECMISAGYAKECANTYKSIRKSIVDESIYRLGVEKISSSKAKKMPYEVVELKTKRWIEAVKVSMKTLFISEKTLCDEVFESSASLRESCFRDISKEGALLLFGFPETVAVRDKKNPHMEKIFPLLDMYCMITENLLAIEAIFSFPSISAVRTQAHSSLTRLSESILSHLAEFESEIRKDTSKTMVRGGGVHPMTISVMDHISRLSEYSSSLMDILDGSPSSSPDKSMLPKSYFNVTESEGSPSSELKVRFAWLILVLLCKIDGKAEMYKEFSMQYLFLTNNLQHVVSRARSTNLKQLLGDDWITRHFEKVKQFARSYERLAWDPLVSMCPTISTCETVGMSNEEAKMQSEKFNESFEKTCEAQSECVIPDLKLLDEMRMSIRRKLLPIYRDFYNAHRNAVMLIGKEGGWNIRYTPEDIEYRLSELFTGKGISDNRYVCMEDLCVVRTATTTGSLSCRRKTRSLSCRRF